MGYEENLPVEVLELNAAKTRDPGNPFVKSCEEFFAKTGFLTPKQLSCIRKVKARERKPQEKVGGSK